MQGEPRFKGPLASWPLLYYPGLKLKPIKLVAPPDGKSGLRRQGHHHVEQEGIAVSLASPLRESQTRRIKFSASQLGDTARTPGHWAQKGATNLQLFRRGLRNTELLARQNETTKSWVIKNPCNHKMQHGELEKSLLLKSRFTWQKFKYNTILNLQFWTRKCFDIFIVRRETDFKLTGEGRWANIFEE